MASTSTKENVPLTLPRQTSRPRPPPSTPLRPRQSKMANDATEPPPVSGGGVRCMCFRLPSRTSKKPPPPLPAPKLRSASSRSAVAPAVSAARAPSQSQRVTFRATVSLSTRWPPSPSSASAGATGTQGPAGSGGSVVAAPRRASASSAVAVTIMKAGAATGSSTSFSHWRRCRSPTSSRVMPHGERASFSFAVSPASSCMNTPKIQQGWQQK